MTMKPTKRLRILILLLIPRLAIWIVNLGSESFGGSRIVETTTHHPPARLRLPRQRMVEIFALSLVGGLVGGLVLWAQAAKQPAPIKAPAQPISQASPNGLPPLQLDGDAALHHLNQVIRWYRSTTAIQSVGLPSDAIYQDNMQSLTAQVVRLAFQSAKAETVITITLQKAGGASPASGETAQQQNLARLQENTSSQIDQLQSQIETLNAQIPKAPASRKSTLISKRDALQGQLELQKALLDAVQKMASFVETNGEIAGGLEGGINQLARSIPEVLGSSASPQKTVAAPTSAKPSLANSGGLISEAMTLYDYMSAMHRIDDAVRETDYTRDVADQLRTPLRDALRATIKQSQTLANQPPATDPQQLQAERQNFQEITERFKDW